ncbi:MAG TPA: hypothetical protein VGK71_09465 [Nitrospirota bacterium]
MKIKVPEWVQDDVGEKAITMMLASEAFAKMEYYRTRVSAFEKKYKAAFPDFEEKIKAAAKEDPAKWDDYISWDANNSAYLVWKQKYEELLECSK